MVSQPQRWPAEVWISGLLGLALGALPWSKAGVSIFCSLSVLVGSLFYGRQFLASCRILGLPLAIFVLTFSVAFLFSPDGALALKEGNSLWAILLVPVGMLGVRNDKQLDIFIVVFFGLTALAGLTSILQSWDWVPTREKYHGRSFATTDPWSFADAMAYALPIAMISMMHGKLGFLRKLAFPAAIFIGCGLVLSGQRMPLVAGLLATGVVMVIANRLKLSASIGLGMGVFGLLLTGLWWNGSLSEVFPLEPSDSARVSLWMLGWEVFSQHPWTGAGMGMFREIGMSLSSDLNPEFDLAIHHMKTVEMATAHNTPLHILATQGIVGLIGTLCFLGVLVRPLFSNPKRTRSLIGISALVTFACCSMTDVPFLDSARLVPFLLLMGVALGGQVSTLPQVSTR